METTVTKLEGWKQWFTKPWNETVETTETTGRRDGDEAGLHWWRQRRTAKPADDGDDAVARGKDGNGRKGENNGDETQNKKLGPWATPMEATSSPTASPRKGVLESLGWIPVSAGRQTDDGQTATVGLAIAVVRQSRAGD